MSNQYTKKPKRRVITVSFKYAAEGLEVWEALVKEFGERVAHRITEIVWRVQNKHTKMRDKATSNFGTGGRNAIGEATRKRIKAAAKRVPKPWKRSCSWMAAKILDIPHNNVGVDVTQLRKLLKALHYPDLE